MSRDPTWAATSVPEIRSRWCNALDALADRQTEIIESPPEGGATAGVAKRIERSAVPVVVLQEGLRRARLLIQLGGYLAHDFVDGPAERLNAETDCQRPQLSALVRDGVPLLSW
jgi:hypothetical protein